MKKNKTTLTAGAIVLAAMNHVYGQYVPPAPPPFAGFLNEYLRTNYPSMNAWDFGGAERLRFEDHEGYNIPGEPGSPAKANDDFRAHGADVNNSYLMSRLRFHAGYTDKWWGAYAEGQSSLEDNDKRWAYFAKPTPAGEVNRQGDGPESDTVNLHQAYVTVGNVSEFPLSLKVGRQVLSYGEERLVGAFDWNNIGRTFDAAKVRWESDWVGADFFTSREVIPQDGRFDTDNDHELFSGVYATTLKIPANILDVYFLARNASTKALTDEPSPQFPQPSARDIYTAGGRFKSKPGEVGNWDYSVEGAYQFGDFRDTRAGAPTTRLTQNAFMAVVQGGYTFANFWAKPRLGAEFDYSSGDDNPKDGTHGTFDNLFPTNHKFYGSMDFASLENIEDAGVNLSLKPHRRLTFTLMGNFLWLANTHDNFYTVAGAPRGGVAATPGTGYGINPNYNSYVGSELTAIGGWAMTRFAQLEAGYGHFFHGDYLAHTWSAPGFGGRDADFAYAQINLKF
jgi:hypothetical protein